MAATLLAGVLNQPAGAAPRKSLPDLTITNVGKPTPPGARFGGTTVVDAVEQVRRGKTPASETGFYLSADAQRDDNDVKIGEVKVPALSPGHPQAVHAELKVETPVDRGFYNVLACADDTNKVRESDEANNCKATPGQIDIGGETARPFGGARPTGDPTPASREAFPENPADGMSVAGEFDCPLSAHGQWPSKCVWVTTARIVGSEHRNNFVDNAYWYCPTDHKYPYEVALGWDPMWDDLKSDSFEDASIRTVSGTKYLRTGDNHDVDWSYSGTDSSDFAQRGYVFGRLQVGLNRPDNYSQMRFLCSNAQANSHAP
jgi:hypothetical protein